jgi:hypothetical protein
MRVGSLTTLFDGKMLNHYDPLIWETIGTGLSSFQTNKLSLSVVTNGQYMIMESKRCFPYFSGKSQQVEITSDNFHTENGIVKRQGYFSSISAAPYNTQLDGFFLEDDGTTKRLKGYRFGTETMNVPMSAWDNYSLVQNYDWSNFTVTLFDFLWLGGAILRFFVRVPSGLQLIHTFHYPGTSKDVFNQSPNQPLRYEIRSTGGIGEFRPICSQVATEGSINESGKIGSINTGQTGFTLASNSLTYPLLGIRLNPPSRDKSVSIIGMQAFTNTSDQMIISLILNPTITLNGDTITWSNIPNRAIQRGIISTGPAIDATVTDGTTIMSFIVAQNSVIPPNILTQDFLSILGISINNISDELWVCCSPLTTTITTYGVLNFKEY